MTLKLTILGCGTSGGVPRVGNIWGACDPSNPKNRRRRCSVLVQKEGGEGTTTVLVDASPDLREQLLDIGVGWLDGVLFTHDHADHTHGIDDLRMVSYNGRRRVAVYYDQLTGQQLKQRFAYCFNMSANGEYPPILDGHEIAPGVPVKVLGQGGGIEALPFRQRHGTGETLGFRFGGIAYSPDVSDLPEESLEYLESMRSATCAIRAISASMRRFPGSRESSRSARCSPTCMSILTMKRWRESCPREWSLPMTA
jgi:phosphoribosyl 1,2-cyclic phosphate phosphodiesterase